MVYLARMNPEVYRYFVLHKPYNMVSQFVSPDKVRLLKEINFAFPEGTHAIGRLDRESEGLLLLTTDRRITRLLFEGSIPHRRTYLVQVRRQVTPEALQLLQTGITIRIEGGALYTTPPCAVHLVTHPDAPPPPFHIPPQVATSWLSITLTEGKFRQVRKMVAAAGHRCLRLIRTSIEDLHLGTLPAGAVQELNAETFFTLLRLEAPPLPETH